MVVHAAPVRGRDDVRRAWWSLALFVPAFFLAFLVGEGLASLLGWDPAADPSKVPGWEVALGAGVPAVLVFASPVLATAYYGRRAARRGRYGAWWPTWTALFVAGAFAAQNLLSWLVGTIA